MEHSLPLNANTLGTDEINAATAVLKSGFFTMGARCFEFEEQFARYVGVKNAIYVNSGSSANLLTFFALANPQLKPSGGKRRLNPGDEVIVPAVAWSTTIWPIVQAGGVPVLVDSDPYTLQMNLEQLEGALSPKTVGICAVHVLGGGVPMDPVLEIAKKRGLWVVEDNCESLGTKYRGKYTGTLGDIATFSFFFSHHITTIEGGMIVTNDDDLAEMFRSLRAHGWTRHLKNRKKVEAQFSGIDPRFLFVNTGFNVRPTEVNAAIGLVQLKRLQDFNKRRREIAERWIREFKDYRDEGLLTPMQPTEETEASWYGFPVLCQTKELRDELTAHLEAHRVETRPIICGNMARQPAFRYVKHRIHGSLSGADAIMNRGLFWGVHPLMGERDVSYLVDTVHSFFVKA